MLDNASVISAIATALAESTFACVLTGAGISAESGLATFRGPEGLWKGRDPSEVATPQAFARDPRGVWEFYRWRLRQAGQARPNAGHEALVELQRRLPGFGLITQNVDRLHQLAGSRNVVELHGNIRQVRCIRCPFVSPAAGHVASAEPRCPECGDWLRPCVVWFNEMLPEAATARAAELVRQCDVFMSIGTSAQVWPAAQLAFDAKALGATVIEINLEPTPLTPFADIAIHGKCGEILPAVVARMQQLLSSTRRS